MRSAPGVVLLLALASSCGRTEEPPGSRTAAAPPAARAPASPTSTSSTPGPSAAAASDRPRCVVPSPAEPPPIARKAERCPRDPDGNPQLPTGRVRFVDARGAPVVDVELARTPEHRERGLMYRTELASGRGMLFSWDEENVRSFWMRNTCIPLDMLFIARDGFITGILEQVPTLNDAPRSIPCPAAHVLEVPGGWTRAAGVSAGQRVVIDS